MLSILLTFILLLIRFSVGDQCSSLNYCTCSSDKTIIQCTNRQITNDLLLILNSQLPKSTILLNLSSNFLTSVKSLSNLNSLQTLDLSFNKIRFLPSNIFSKFPQLRTLNVRNNSLKSIPKSFKKISNINLNISNNPFHCTCQFKRLSQTNLLNNLICQNNKRFNENDFCPKKNFTQQSKIISENKSELNDKNSSNIFCQSIQMNTSKGYFYWPRTLINKKIEKKCPFGSAAWLSNSSEYARAYYTCSNRKQWIHFDVSQCAFQTNISRVLDYLSINETNLLLNLVKYLSKINQYHMKLDDIILLIDLIDEQQEKYKNQDRIMLIYHLTDFILQIKHDFIHSNQYQTAITRLRLIVERLLDYTNQSWLYIGKELTAMTIQSPSPSTLCFISNRSLLKIICEIDNQHHKSQLATIQFPSDLNKTNHYSLFRIIFYRQSTLFISDTMGQNNNPVIYIRQVSRNNSSTIQLTFYSQLNQASIGIRHSNQTSWQIKSSICQINEQNKNLISTNCILSNNNSYSITYFNRINDRTSIFLTTKYPQIAVYTSSIIASICFFISILSYIYIYKVHTIPRLVFHCLINYWLSLGVLLLLFAFGMQQHRYPFLCQFIAICLYYLCLITIVWLTLLTYSIWRKLHIVLEDKDHQKKSSIMTIEYDNIGLPIKKIRSKPVIQFYMLAHGIASVICGINVALSREKFMTNNMCFLSHFDSILILIISILIFIFVILIFLLFARNHIKNLTAKTLHLHTLQNQSGIKSNNIFLSSLNSQSNINGCHASDIDHQHTSINILLSILFQLILLIFLFLSSLTIYLHPLQSFKLRFEHIIYSHLYGFFVLFLAVYILSFNVLSRYHFKRKKTHPPSPLINEEYDIPSFTEQVSPLHVYHSSNVCEVPLNNERTMLNDDYTTPKYYTCRRCSYKTNETSSSQTILNRTLPFSSSDTFSQDILEATQSHRHSFYDRSINSLMEFPITQLHSSPLISSQSYIHPRSPPSQAIIRPLPITRLSSRNTNKKILDFTDITQSRSSIVPNSYHLIPSSSTEDTTVYSNKTAHQKLLDENLLISKKPPDSHMQVIYIDEDDGHSVSLKSSETSMNTITTKTDRLQILSAALSSSSSSSSEFSNDFHKYIIHSNPMELHESSV